MSNMRDRQEGFERKFALDEETRFKAIARRNKLLGLWAAEKLGKSDEEAEVYAKDVVRADFEEAGDEDVFRKVFGDLQLGGAKETETDVRKAMEELLLVAAEQVRS